MSTMEQAIAEALLVSGIATSEEASKFLDAWDVIERRNWAEEAAAEIRKPPPDPRFWSRAWRWLSR